MVVVVVVLLLLLPEDGFLCFACEVGVGARGCCREEDYRRQSAE